MIKIDDFYTIENMDDTELINYRSWLTSHLNLNDDIQNVSVYGYGSNIGRSKSIEYNARGNICRIRYYDGYTNTPLHENFPSQIEFFGDKLPVIETIEFKNSSSLPMINNFNSNPRTFKVYYDVNGNIKRKNLAVCNSDGKINQKKLVKLIYYNNGKKIVAEHYEYGNKKEHYVYELIDGDYKIHNELDAAHVVYTRYGSPIKKEFFLEDKYMTDDETIWDIRDKIRSKTVLKNINRRTNPNKIKSILNLTKHYLPNDNESIQKIEMRLMVLKLQNS